MPRKRNRSRSPAGECYAQIPQEVIEGEAYAAVPDYAVRVLNALASEYRGVNNGNLSLTVARARELGVRSAWKVTAGLRVLLDTGLIEMTRPGKYSHGRGMAALYALGWRAIDINPQAFPPINIQRAAPNAWARWQLPDNWEEHEQRIRKAAKGSAGSWNDSTTIPHVGNKPVPHVRNKKTSTSSSREVQESTFPCSSRGGDPLDLGLGAINGRGAKVSKLLIAQPHLLDADVAKITCEPIEFVQQIRTLHDLDAGPSAAQSR